MKILFSKIELCPEGIDARKISVSERRKTQSEGVIGAQNALVFDRANRVIYISFEVERCHVSTAEAGAFALGHSAMISGLSPADLDFVLNGRSSLKSPIVRFPSAALSKASCSAEGVKTVSSYEFQAVSSENIQ